MQVCIEPDAQVCHSYYAHYGMLLVYSFIQDLQCFIKCKVNRIIATWLVFSFCVCIVYGCFTVSLYAGLCAYEIHAVSLCSGLV